MNEQARHRLTPNQVRPPPDCRFTSGCSPPRLTATQLPSITEPATGSGADLHRAVKASSLMYGPFPERKDEDGLDGHVFGLLMPEGFGLPAWGEHSGIRWDHSDGLWGQ